MATAVTISIIELFIEAAMHLLHILLPYASLNLYLLLFVENV